VILTGKLVLVVDLHEAEDTQVFIKLVLCLLWFQVKTLLMHFY